MRRYMVRPLEPTEHAVRYAADTRQIRGRYTADTRPIHCRYAAAAVLGEEIVRA